MARMRSRSGNIDPEEPTPFDEVIRRADQAEDRLDAAVEVEDFQAVGMLLRESLISLIQVLRRRVPLQDRNSPTNPVIARLPSIDQHLS